MIASLGASEWALLVGAALIAGFAKTAIGGAGALAVALFALALPARASTGALLPLLIAGDLVAVLSYHRHASWRTLWRLVPAVLPGLLLGAWFIDHVDDGAMRVTLGFLLSALTAWQLVQRWRRLDAIDPSVAKQSGGLLTLCAGLAAGFCTMTANAGGPVMTVYLLMAGLPMLEMLGTAAWFFLVVNLLKVPLSASLELITASSLALDAALVLPMVIGAVVGRWSIRRLRQRQFEIAALGLSVVAAGLLLVV